MELWIIRIGFYYILLIILMYVIFNIEKNTFVVSIIVIIIIFITFKVLYDSIIYASELEHQKEYYKKMLSINNEMEDNRTMNNDPEYFDLKQLTFNYDLSKCNFELDILQDKLLQFYLRSDHKFRKAFMTNYTKEFFQFIQDKARLNESLHISTIGQVRSSKSTSMITISVFHQAVYSKKFTIDYVCGNQYEYIEKLQTYPENKLFNRIFLLDEEKQSVFGSGSVARKLKLQDVNNIIAKNNISTISINPQTWANPFSFYGMRAFGKCRKTGINRFMLYNLQSYQSTASPMGLVFIPMFQKIIPESYSEELNKKYLEKKDKWIEAEMRGESDVLSELRKNSAKEFLKDKQFLSLKKKSEKLTYIITKLGSEWTKGEYEEVFNLTKILEQGIEFD